MNKTVKIILMISAMLTISCGIISLLYFRVPLIKELLETSTASSSTTRGYFTIYLQNCWSLNSDLIDDVSGADLNLTGTNLTWVRDRFNVSGGAAFLNGTNFLIPPPRNYFINLEYTITLWIYYIGYYTNSNGAYGSIFEFSNGIQTSSIYLGLDDIKTGVVNFATYDVTRNRNEYLKSSVLSKNKWYFIAVSVFGTQCLLYVNDQVFPGLVKATVNMTRANNYIGRNSYNDGNFIGYIDDFKIYSKSFNTAEILTLYNISRVF